MRNFLKSQSTEQNFESHYEVLLTSGVPRRDQVRFLEIVSWVWWTCVVTPGLPLGCLQWFAAVLDARLREIRAYPLSLSNDESVEPYQKYLLRARHIRPEFPTKYPDLRKPHRCLAIRERSEWLRGQARFGRVSRQRVRDAAVVKGIKPTHFCLQPRPRLLFL